MEENILKMSDSKPPYQDNFEEVYYIVFVVNTSTALVTLVCMIAMNIYAYVKYRKYSYDRVTAVVLSLFLASFSIRFLGYLL